MFTPLAAVATAEAPGAIATYKYIGLYRKTPAAQKCTVQYGPAGGGGWKQA